jgi:hypothetical protein
LKEDIFSKLHYHSGLVAQGCWDELDEYDREAIIRFGKLIVQECAKIADVERPNSIGCGYITKTKGMLIREHFGVAE